MEDLRPKQVKSSPKKFKVTSLRNYSKILQDFQVSISKSYDRMNSTSFGSIAIYE